MEFIEWFPLYQEIREQFGYSTEKDQEAAKVLSHMTRRKALDLKVLRKKIHGKKVMVVGAGVNLESSIQYIKRNRNFTKIVDIIVGYIDMLFGSMISVRILYINDVKSISGFSAISTTRGISLSGGQGGWSRDRGDRRSRVIFRVGDIIRGRVVSLLNSNIHITISEKDFGVVYTLCYNCGGNTVRVNNAVKCIECGTYEERKLTSDYGKETFSIIHNGKTLNGGI